MLAGAMHSRRRGGVGRLCVTALLTLAPMVSMAGDRPFIATASAAAEEDDDAVWSLETVFQRVGPVRSIAVAAEYAFNPTDSVQLEFTHARDREAGESERGFGLEYKHLFNHIARDGYGVGVVVAADVGRPASGGWRVSEWSVVMPVSFDLASPGSRLHLNVGLSKPRQARREWTGSLGVEHEVAKRTVLFAEAARTSDGRLLHGGVRYWAQREKLAIDLSLQRLQVDGTRRHGFVFGLGWYDL